MILEGWIIVENLRPLLESIGCFVAHEFDFDAWTAISWRIR